MEKKIGNCIGTGGCSEVFEWEEDKIIKLFRSNTNEYAVNREYRNSIAAWEAGLPVARAYELLKLDGRPGIVFERIKGETMKERLTKLLSEHINPKPVNDEKVDSGDNDILTTARVLYEIHNKYIPGMQNQVESLKWSIGSAGYLTDKEINRVYEILDNLPRKNCLCHGDPNPGNFFIREGKPVIIDWMNATIGNPEADLAEYIIMIRYAIISDEIPASTVDFINSVREAVIDMFLDEYIRLSGITREEIDAWIVPVAARKLKADAISEEEKAELLKVIRAGL